MAVNTDTTKFGLSVEEADVWRVYIRGYVDEKSDTWTEMKCNYSVNIVSTVCFFIHLVLIGMLPSPTKTVVKLNGVMMWLL